VIYSIKHISVSINKSVDVVYNFISNPENLPLWAAGLSSSIRKEGEFWIADSPMGEVKVLFAEKNPYGVLDHKVILPNGITVNNPMRVLQNSKGSEVIFSLFQLEGMTDEQFENDAKLVQSDLKKLKELLEAK